jgi:hypothetical protein
MSGDTGPAQERRAIDTTVAHSARVHDYWLGGKDNYPARLRGLLSLPWVTGHPDVSVQRKRTTNA